MKKLKFGIIRIVIVGLLFLSQINMIHGQQPNQNPPPKANDDRAAINGNSVNIAVLDNDVYSGTSVFVSVTKFPTYGEIIEGNNGNALLYEPMGFVYKEEGFEGKDTIGYSVCNVGGACDTAFVFIEYKRPSDPEGGTINPGELIFDPVGMLAAEIIVVRNKFKDYGGVRKQSCPCGDLELWEFPNWDVALTSKGITEETELDNDKLAFNYRTGIFDLDAVGLSNLSLDDIPAATSDVKPLVAIVDSGVEPSLEEFDNFLWSIPNSECGFMAGNVGYNVLDTLSPMMDEDGHGTHLGGIVLKDNPYVQIMPLRVVSEVKGNLFDAICGIRFAVKNEARVINLSLTQKGARNGVFDTTIKMAQNAGIIVVCSAGNDGKNLDNDTIPYWPGGFDYDNIINVTAIDAKDSLCDFSNYGERDVDIAAPGLNIQSLPSDSTSSNVKSGTSMATAFVTREVALAQYKNPTWTYQQIVGDLYDRSVAVPSLVGKTSQGKRIGGVSYQGADNFFRTNCWYICIGVLILLLILLFLLIKKWKKKRDSRSY